MARRRWSGIAARHSTLVEEVGVDLRAGNEWLLSRASYRAPDVTLERVLERAARVAREIAGRRDAVHLETPWPTLTRLIHDYFGTQWALPMAELEIGFWRASVRAQPMPGAREALDALTAWLVRGAGARWRAGAARDRPRERRRGRPR